MNDHALLPAGDAATSAAAPLARAMQNPRPALAVGRVAAWRGALLLLACVWALLLLVFWPEWEAMARQWWEVSTYNHIVLVPFILVWLVQMRWAEVARLTPLVWWPGLALFFGAGFLWLAGHIAGVNLVSQLGAVAMMQASAATVLGPRVCAGLLFPLGYMLLLVPLGEELVPLLQTLTAKMAIAFTVASGVPAEIDGVFINTPAGLFEVAEECSGVKFLIAMVAFSLLVANLCFQSNKRRALFLAFAWGLPVFANAIRAWGTIYFAQIYGIEKAAGFDHIVYGWVFFALVVAALLAGSWRYFDRPVNTVLVNSDALNANRLLSRLAAYQIRPSFALLAMGAAVWLVMVWGAQAQSLKASLPQTLRIPDVPGWTAIAYRPQISWVPRATGADRVLLASYQNAGGATVDVFYALYASQDEGRDATGFGEGALVPGTQWRWHSAATPSGQALPYAKAQWLRADGTSIMRLAQTLYRSGGYTAGSAAGVKLAQLRDRALLSPRPTALLIIAVEADNQELSKRAALDAIAQFHHAIGSPSRWMDRAGFNP